MASELFAGHCSCIREKGVKMAVKVLIRRRFPRDKQKELYRWIRKIRGLVPQQPGYISSEYLKSIETQDEIIAISSWFSFEDWQAWFESAERKELQANIDAIEGVTTEYTSYRHITTR
jgi:heme-degrading monooxygenase HmoA